MLRSLAIGIVALLVLVPCASAATTSSARAALEMRLPEAKLTNVTLADALDFLRDIGGANIIVDWKALDALNIGKDTPININLHSVRLAKVLSLVLSEAAPGDLLTFYVDENVIQITSRAEADKKLIVIVYNVMDLLAEQDPFEPLQLSDTFLSSGGPQVQGGSGTGGNTSATIFSGNAGTATTITKQEEADKLIKLIETIIRPDIWKTNGGVADIEYYNGNLIVSAPRSIQEAIGGPVD
jgi:hypothetical protein